MLSSFIVFQAYGNKDILHEALIAISSILRFGTVAPTQIVVYTDLQPYLRKWLPEGIVYVDTPQEKWEEWKGSHKFVHRAKIQMLRDFTIRVSGNILYCDTDTYFLHPPEQLFATIASGELCMHVDEGPLKNSENLIFKKLVKFLKGYRKEHIPVDTHMWNAGVLGFQSSDKRLLDRVLELSDNLHSAYPKHVMEQLAFSVVFQTRKRRDCAGLIFHYWDFKEYRTVLSVFFSENEGLPYSDWSSRVEDILPMDLRKSKKEKKSLPWWKRLLG